MYQPYSENPSTAFSSTDFCFQNSENYCFWGIEIMYCSLELVDVNKTILN